MVDSGFATVILGLAGIIGILGALISLLGTTIGVAVGVSYHGWSFGNASVLAVISTVSISGLLYFAQSIRLRSRRWGTQILHNLMLSFGAVMFLMGAYFMVSDLGDWPIYFGFVLFGGSTFWVAHQNSKFREAI